VRTTLNIDVDVLKAAQAKAGYEDISVGKALSEIARQGLKPAPMVSRRKNRLPQFTLPGSVIITAASVQDAQEEDND
jgi:hypothetical protein